MPAHNAELLTFDKTRRLDFSFQVRRRQIQVILLPGDQAVHAVRVGHAALVPQPEVPGQDFREEAVRGADVLVIAPSNPFVSIDPILAVPGLRATLERRAVPCVAVSPLIGGRAVKGPLDRMLLHMSGDTSPRAVAACYPGLVDLLLVDRADADAPAGMETLVTDTLMPDRDAARRLARTVLEAVT